MGSGVPHGSGNRHHSPADELPGVPIPSDFERLEPGAGGEIEALSNERAADLARCTGGVGVARNPTGCTERRRWSFPREGRDECGKREEEQQRGCPAPTQGTEVVGSPVVQPCLPEGVSGYHGGGPTPPQAWGMRFSTGAHAPSRFSGSARELGGAGRLAATAVGDERRLAGTRPGSSRRRSRRVPRIAA